MEPILTGVTALLVRRSDPFPVAAHSLTNGRLSAFEITLERGDSAAGIIDSVGHGKGSFGIPGLRQYLRRNPLSWGFYPLLPGFRSGCLRQGREGAGLPGLEFRVTMTDEYWSLVVNWGESVAFTPQETDSACASRQRPSAGMDRRPNMSSRLEDDVQPGDAVEETPQLLRPCPAVGFVFPVDP